MTTATIGRARAAKLPEGDVIRILLEQHARVRDLFTEIKASAGSRKRELFDELRQLLAAHETAEEMILRPTSRRVAGEAVAEARNREEAEASATLARLETLDPGTAEFDTVLAGFERAVLDHADLEERDEFSQILIECDESERKLMGVMLQSAEAVAPTHPHPSTAGSTTAQWAVGPFASLADRTRDAIRKVLD
jgi:hemerythrin superfamily protein